MTSRPEILSKIAKLRQMTTANGASEGEAMFAAQRVASMIAEFNVSQSEMEIRTFAKDGCITDEFAVIGNDDWTRVVVGLQHLFHVRCWYHHTKEDLLDLGTPIAVKYVKFFGFPEDVAGAMFLATMIREAFATELARYVRDVKRGRDTRSFGLGMGDRINERLKSMATQQVTGPSKGTGLMVLKGQLVGGEFDKLGLRLRYGPAAWASNHNAYTTGQNAGSRANLHGRSASLRIGN